MSTIEHERLEQSRSGMQPWKLSGTCLYERQRGTVREDYSDDGDSWNYFTHDQARLRADTWGEDGLAGISDDKQRLCWLLALWNGQDPLPKDRLFGLTNAVANHGEDVHQTGWTGAVVRHMQHFALVDAPSLLAQGTRQAFYAANV